ncbi:MAG: tetratricopeptide repeat protein [Phycisphaera sp.]|nr:MAG: tetratricopeptide repeat protein [Phycisphaera sp.]
MRAVLAIAVVAFLTHATLAQDGDRSLRTANGLLQRGLHAEAAAEYSTALRSLDNAASRDEARYGLAMAEYNLGRDADALRTLSGLETGSRFAFRADADVLRTHLYFRQKDYPRAADAARAAVAHRDHAAWAGTASLLIESSHRAGRHEQAIESYSSLADRMSRDRDAYRRASFFAGLSQTIRAKRERDHAQAAEWFERALPPRGRDELGDLAMLHQAQALRRAGRTADAISTYQRAVARGGERTKPDAMLQLAAILRAEGRSGEAANVLRMLADDSPRHQPARVQFELGLALLDIDELADAARALDRAERAGDTELADDIAYWRAKTDLRRDRASNAAERLKTALERHSRSPLAAEMRYDLAVALQRDGEGTAASRAFAQFFSAHPDHAMAPDALYAMASLALDAGDTEQASELASQFTSTFSRHPLATNARFIQGEAAYRKGEYRAASRAFAPLIEAPDGSLAQQARYRLGMSLHAQGQSDEATKHLRVITEGRRTRAEFLPALFTLADIAFEAGEWQEAERGFGQYVQAAGEDGEGSDAATMKVALAQLRQNNTNEAIETLDTLLSTWPRSGHVPHALFELAQAHVSQGNDARAQRGFERLLEQHGDTRFAPHALRHMAAIASRAGEAQRAADLYAQAAERGGSALAIDIALERARALINAGRPQDAANLLRGMDGPARAWRVIALSRAGEHGEAVTLANRLGTSGLDAESASLYQYALATSLRNTGESERASRVLATLSSSDSPTSANAAVDLADLLIASKDYAQAADLLEPFASHDSLGTTAMYKAAWARYQLNDHRRVVALLDDKNLGELTGPGAMLLGESLLELKRGREAAEQFEVALQHAGDGVEPEAALLRLGEAHAAAQDWRKSQAAYERHRREHARSPRWYMAEFGVGWALENSGKPREAMPHYKAVTDKHKGDTAARAQFQLGECLFALKEHEEAVRELLRVDILHASPTWSAAALYEAGRCFEAMGKVGEARAQYRAVRERFAESDWATAAGERLAAIAGPGGTRTSGRGG